MKLTRLLSGTVVAAVAAVLLASSAFAATYTWSGGANASWAAAGSWSPARTTPATSDVLIFNSGGLVTATAVPTQTIAQLTVTASTAVTPAKNAESNAQKNQLMSVLREARLQRELVSGLLSRTRAAFGLNPMYVRGD